MPITELLERNAKEYANDVALVELNPAIQERRRVTYNLESPFEFDIYCVKT